MSNDLIRHDPNLNALRAATRITDPAASMRIPSHVSSSGLSDTHMIIHRDGTGASTLGHFLECLIPGDPLIIEVGTNRSRAFQHVPEARHFHMKVADDQSLAEAMDWRMERPSKPAIIECGRTLFLQGIQAAEALTEEALRGRVIVHFIANEHDQNLKVPELARQCGLGNVLVFDEPKSRQSHAGGSIRIPLLTTELQDQIYMQGKSLRDALASSQKVFSSMIFYRQFRSFAEEVIRSLMP